MAIGFSENQLNYARKRFYGNLYITDVPLSFFDKLINKSLICIFLFKYSLVNLKRKILRNIQSQTKSKSNHQDIKFSINLDHSSIKRVSEELNLKNFSFIENFLSKESYNYLLNSWPNINYFNHHKQIIKNYNSGFNHKPELSIDKTFGTSMNTIVLKKFYEFILSDEFKKVYNNLINFEKNDYNVCAISSKMAPNGSYLIPHIDGVMKNKNTQQHYNFIYFIDGYEEDPILGGATGFYKDNEFKNPIFIPHTIKNSLLIYNQSENFYHGFKTIQCPKNIVRKSVGFQIKPNNLAK